MAMRHIVAGIIASVLLGPAVCAAQTKEEPFGQEKVATRAHRTPQRLGGHDHANGREGGRAHGHRHGKKGRHHHGHSHGKAHRHGGAERHDSHSHRPGEAHDHAGRSHGHAHKAGADHDHGLETENIFGFTLGSDVHPAGSRAMALENVLRLGKRPGRYEAFGQKLEFSYAATDNLELVGSLLGDHHRVRNVSGFDDVGPRYAFNGFGGEIRWRLLDRHTAPFGLTLHAEPAIVRIDEASGLAGRGIGSENKIIFDKELVPDTLFAAINLLYDVERFKERLEPVEKASNAGISAALTYQLSPKVLVGGEVRYVRAYDGFALDRWQGHAVFVGPTFFAKLPGNGWISAAWNVQVGGREAVNRRENAETLVAFRAETAAAIEAQAAAIAAGEEPQPLPDPPVFRRRGRLDLANFERQMFRVKIGFEF
jgi:hypothetical protein